MIAIRRPWPLAPGATAGVAPPPPSIRAIHPLCLEPLARAGINRLWISPLVGIPATTALAFSLSLLIVWLASLIPGIRRLVC